MTSIIISSFLFFDTLSPFCSHILHLPTILLCPSLPFFSAIIFLPSVLLSRFSLLFSFPFIPSLSPLHFSSSILPIPRSLIPNSYHKPSYPTTTLLPLRLLLSSSLTLLSRIFSHSKYFFIFLFPFPSLFSFKLPFQTFSSLLPICRALARSLYKGPDKPKVIRCSLERKRLIKLQ